VNKYHTPALYAAFLRALINVRDGTSGPATRHTSVAPTPAPPTQHTSGSAAEVSEQLSPFVDVPSEGQAPPPPPALDIPLPEYNMIQQPSMYGEPSSAFQNAFQPQPGGPVAAAAAPDPNQPMPGQVQTDFGDYTFGAGLGGSDMQVDELGNLNGPFGGILTDAFWDSVLIPGMYSSLCLLTVRWLMWMAGYSNTLDLSGGFVFGSGGSGLITPRVGSPTFGNAGIDFGTDTMQHRA
jgi:hypothetical protein